MLYKYMSNFEHATSLIGSGKLWFSNLGSLNDPFEGDFAIDDDELSKIAGLPHFQDGPDKASRVGSWIHEFRCSLRQKFYICSLSEIKDDILMWSHYAKQHEGIVIGFDFLDNLDHFLVSESWAKSKIVQNCGIIAHLVKYSKSPASLQITGDPDAKFWEILTQKTEQWNYEKEKRIIIHDSTIRDKGKVVDINKSIIKTVYFGMRVSRSVIDKTIRDANRSDIVYKKMIMRHGYFSLIPIEA